MVSRAQKTFASDWWWTVDRWLLGAIGALMVLGIVLTMAGSPAVAERLGLPAFHFVNRQVLVLIPAALLLVATSLLSPRAVRRAALVAFALSLALIVVALVFGHEVKGSKRWIFGVQPSEFLKPAFVVLAAWAFAEGGRRHDVPGNMLALLLLPLAVVPLVLQPDIGQSSLIFLVWAALFVMAGLHWFWVAGIGGAGAVGAFAAYKLLPHVHDRVMRFLEPQTGPGGADTFQVDTAVDAILSGGWLGKGVGEGTYKRILPDSHTDFIMAVTAEEFGILFCLAVVAVFAFIVLRGLFGAAKNPDPFCRFAAAGLVMEFGLQSSINMAVNLQLMPAKGMTLPFISYGGSSLLSLAMGMGFLVAVTRKRPRSQIVGAESLRPAPADALEGATFGPSGALDGVPA